MEEIMATKRLKYQNYIPSIPWNIFKKKAINICINLYIIKLYSGCINKATLIYKWLRIYIQTNSKIWELEKV